MKRREIIANYLGGWFWLDLLASFPYSWVITYDENITGMVDNSTDPFFDDNVANNNSTASNNSTYGNSTMSGDESGSSSSIFRAPQLLRFLKIMRFIRILRLLRVLRLHRLFIRLEENIASETMNIIIKFLKLIIMITFIAHWIACFFFAVGFNELPNPESWLVVAGIDQADTSTKYIFSLYWAFATMTTVGYGDIHPNTPKERAVTLITMLVSCVVYAYTIGSIGNLVSRHNMYAAQYKEKMTYVNQFLIRKEIPKELRLKIRRYLEYVLNSKKTVKVD